MKPESVTTWIVIPARGGSRGIPRKNVRLLGDKPLIRHVLEEFSREFDKNQIIVTTDDSEIAGVSEPFARIHWRSPHLATEKATLDDVAVEVAEWLLAEGTRPSDLMLTVQPTSPFIRCATLAEGIRLLQRGARSVISVKDDRHLRWTLNDQEQPKPLYTARVNRQWQPPTLAETGGLFGATLDDIVTTKTRINEPIALIMMDAIEGLDIDNYADWEVAEFYLRRKRIVIRADASTSLGMGHVYRALALAHEMSEHDLVIVTRNDNDYVLGATFLQDHPYRVETVSSEADFFNFIEQFKTQLVVLDILDTTEEYVQRIKRQDTFVVSLEDLGAGGRLADVVINDLYSDLYPLHNHWYGVENAILAPSFETLATPIQIEDVVGTILVTFGGTDVSNQTVKVLSALQAIHYRGEVLVVLGPGYMRGPVDLEKYELMGEVLKSITNMALIAQRADLAITSAGRTVTELMTVGVPTLVMCQNMHELRHTHASSNYGVINLGLGEFVEISTLAQHIQMLLDNVGIRRDMHLRARQAVRERSNQKVVRRIFDAARF